jgi:large subunit ribosomal protein L4
MATLKKYDLNGSVIGQVELEDEFMQADGHSQMIKDYLIALRANLRQWSANTRGRSEVKHTTKKPHRQKGTGGARQGMLVTPQYRGGGIVFGPKPKFDQHVKINRKERRLAIRTLLAEKISGEKVIVMDDASFSSEFAEPKTKKIASFLKTLDVFGRRVLFVGEGLFAHIEEEGVSKKESQSSDKHDNFKLSMRNVPKASYAQASNVNGYDIAAAWTIVMTEGALKELKNLLK